MTARRLLLATLVAVLALASPSVAASTLSFFKTPSKHIACLYSTGDGFPTQLRCDATFLNDASYGLKTHGKGYRFRASDSVSSPKAKTLSYGTSRRFGPFTCTSQTAGLTCTSRSSRHGFFLSKQRQSVF